jgi:hypothetical protein
MKKFFSLTLLLFAVALFSESAKAQTEAQKIELCTKIAGGATLLSSYPVQLPAVADGQRPPIARQATLMRKGNAYRFTICTDEESVGEAILQVYDEGKIIGSSFSAETGKTYQNFDIECHKSSTYIIMISFKDGKEGSAVGILSHVKTL